MRIRTFLILMIILISLVCGGCGDASSQQDGEENSKNTYPMTVEDSMGRQVTIDREPGRIVSLTPANTEILFALGLGDRVVGVTNYCDYPQEATGKEKVGDFYGPSIEKTIALEPDVIFATGGVQKEVVGQLEALGETVVVLDPKTIEEILDSILLAGRVTNSNRQARELVENMRERVEQVEKKLEELPASERVRAFVLVWIEGSNVFSAGQNTFVSSIISTAGGINTAGDTKVEYPQYSIEKLMEKDPEVLINIAHGNPLTEDAIKALRLEELQAVRTGRVYSIEDSDLLTLPGPRIVDGLELVAHLLHPELFPSE